MPLAMLGRLVFVASIFDAHWLAAQLYAGEPVSIEGAGDVTGDGIDDLVHPETLILHHLNVYPGRGTPTRVLEQPHWRLESGWTCGEPATRNVTFFNAP